MHLDPLEASLVVGQLQQAKDADGSVKSDKETVLRMIPVEEVQLSLYPRWSSYMLLLSKSAICSLGF